MGNTDDEAEAYQRIMRRQTPQVVAVVELAGGHAVELVKFRDGSPAWVCPACKLAAMGDFASGFPFIDEIVSAWHEGVLDSRHGDFAAQLAAAKTEIEVAENALSAAQKRRVKLVALAKARAKGWANMSHKDIAAAAGITERTSRKNVTKAKESDD